jgi:8-oxo-dGTP diphosphatase
MADVIMTNLCLIVRDSKLLLGRKTRKIGKGYLMQPGGKVEEGESMVESLVREVREEVGLEVKYPVEMGKITFDFADGSPTIIMYVFMVAEFEGELIDSDQLDELQWFDIQNLPFEKMLPDDKIWMPPILEGKRVEAEFVFDHSPTLENPSKIISQKII